MKKLVLCVIGLLSAICIHYASSRGKLLQELSYDAWGALRSPSTHAVLTAPQALILNRGYCGHEHLINFGFINMNARLYDPYMGRFVSPDPYVQEPQNTQSLNRYAYCINNPLKYSDPSGEIFLEAIFGFYKGVFGWFKGESWYAPFKYAWDNLKNEFKLYGGLFIGNTRQLKSRFTKELPQTIIGLLFSKGRSIYDNTFGKKVDVLYFKGATFIDGVGKEDREYGITIGSYINIWEHVKSMKIDHNSKYGLSGGSMGLYLHEYGHYIQSQIAGPFFLPYFGIPSLLSCTIAKQKHKNFYTEVDANQLSFKFFGFATESEWYDITTSMSGSRYPLYILN